MTRVDDFATRVAQAMGSVAQRQHATQETTAAEMRRLEQERERFLPVADAIHHLEIRPRLEALIQHFPNASCEHWLVDTGFHSHCSFARTLEYPASVKLTVGVLQDLTRHQTFLQYRVSVVPMLFEFEASDTMPVDAESPDMSDVADWLEDKLQRFLELYLRIGSDPAYQRDNQHVDPVCGMHVQAGRAARTERYAQRQHYFCSEECLERFRREPEQYLRRRDHSTVTAAVGPAQG